MNKVYRNNEIFQDDDMGIICPLCNLDVGKPLYY